MGRRGTRVDGLALAAAVFLSGAVLLGVEIAASRVLAPTFGSSLYVWGALIGVVLSGLAIGYWLGGTLADRWPTPYLFVGAIALGAGLVLAIPLVDEWVLDQVVAWAPGRARLPTGCLCRGLRRVLHGARAGQRRLPRQPLPSRSTANQRAERPPLLPAKPIRRRPSRSTSGQ